MEVEWVVGVKICMLPRLVAILSFGLFIAAGCRNETDATAATAKSNGAVGRLVTNAATKKWGHTVADALDRIDKETDEAELGDGTTASLRALKAVNSHDDAALAAVLENPANQSAWVISAERQRATADRVRKLKDDTPTDVSPEIATLAKDAIDNDAFAHGAFARVRTLLPVLGKATSAQRRPLTVELEKIEADALRHLRFSGRQRKDLRSELGL